MRGTSLVYHIDVAVKTIIAVHAFFEILVFFLLFITILCTIAVVVELSVNLLFLLAKKWEKKISPNRVCSPKKRNNFCRISAVTCPQNHQPCSTAAPSWFLLCQSVSNCIFPKSSNLVEYHCCSLFIDLFTGLYWRIHMIEMMPALVWFVLVTLGSTYLIAFAYKNTKFILKHKVGLRSYLSA